MPRFHLLPAQPYRELPGVWGPLLRFSRWSSRADGSPLREDETIQFEALAWIQSGLRPNHAWQRWTNLALYPQGLLRLTDQRLTWIPMSARYLPHLAPLPTVDLELADIASVGRVRGHWLKRLLLFYMPAFQVVLQNGSTYMLAAPFGGTLRDKIAEVAGMSVS